MKIYAAHIENRQKSTHPVKAFNLSTLSPLITTPEFIKAEKRKTGVKIKENKAQKITKNISETKRVKKFLEQLSPEECKQFEPFHIKAEKIKQIFALRNKGKQAESLNILEILFQNGRKI